MNKEQCMQCPPHAVSACNVSSYHFLFLGNVHLSTLKSKVVLCFPGFFLRLKLILKTNVLGSLTFLLQKLKKKKKKRKVNMAE